MRFLVLILLLMPVTLHAQWEVFLSNTMTNTAKLHVHGNVVFHYDTVTQRSVNTAQTWTPVAALDNRVTAMVSIGTDVYAMMMQTPPAAMRFMKSSDNGLTWSQISTVLVANNGVINELIHYGSTLFGVSNRNEIFLSTDNGLTWTQRVYSATTSEAAADGTIASSGMYVLSSAGLYRSADGGVNWVKHNAAQTLTVTPQQIETVNDDVFALGLFGLQRWNNDTQKWDDVSSTLPDYVGFKAQLRDMRSSGSTLYAVGSTFDGLSFALSSTDRGSTWTRFNDPLPNSSGVSRRAIGIAPQHIIVFHNGVGAAAAGNGYYRAQIAASNLPPLVTIAGGSRTIADTDAAPGEVIQLSATASDSDGTIASSEWLINDAVVATGLSANLTLPDGDTVVAFRSIDDDGASSSTSVTLTIQVANPPDTWPSAYSGVAPDPDLGLEFNNIGVFDAETQVIYSCMNIQSNQLPADLGGIPRFDLAFQVVSHDQDTIQSIRILKARAFNPGNLLNEEGQAPSCSGVFEITTGIYEDVIQIGSQTFMMSFQLVDLETLGLILVESVELLPFGGWPAAFAGVAPNPALNLGFNNIGFFNPNDGLIYSCLRIQTTNAPVGVDPVPSFDIALEIVSLEQGLVRLVKFRPFNETNALTETGQIPSCSGVFASSTNRYEDVISVGADAFGMTFELSNPELLQFRLIDIVQK